MKLREALARFEEFLRRRLLGPRHHSVLMGKLRRQLVPALGQCRPVVTAETELTPQSLSVLVRTLQELIARRAHHLSAAARHFLSFLASEGLAAMDALPLRKTASVQRRLLHRIRTADRTRTFEGALGRYLRELREERQLSTCHLLDVEYRGMRFIRDMKPRGLRRPQDVRRADVAAYRDRALAAGITHIYKDLSILRGFFAFLVRNGEVSESPLDGVGAKVHLRAPRTPLTLPELQALIAAPEKELLALPLVAGTPASRVLTRFRALRDRLAIALLIETGLRPFELLSLTVDDIQQVPGTLRVRGKGSRATPKRTRAAYLESKTVLVALRDYLAIRPVGPYRTLLLGPNAQPLTSSGLVLLVRRLARQAGLQRPVRPYDLRVSFASRLVARGADPFALRILMGHDDIRTTLSIYTKLSLEEVRDVWRESNPLAPQPPRRGGRT